MSQGNTNAIEVAQMIGFDRRQSSYYREAAEALGFISFNGRDYALTSAGKQFVSLSAEDRNIFFAQAVNEFELFKQCMGRLELHGQLNRQNIESIIASVSNLSPSTVSRRASSIEAWLKWIAIKTGTFRFQSGVFIANTSN